MATSYSLIITVLVVTLGTVYATKPNIVFLLIDDIGRYDVGYNNPTVLTPNMNELAANGIILDQHYTYQVCSPTRTALLTGRWPFKAAGTKNNLQPTDIDGVNLGFTFLPERLKEAGYATHHVGKWHLGYADYRYTATARGFDTSDGFFLGDQYHFNQTDNTPGGKACPNHPVTSEIFKNGVVQKQLKGIHNTFRFNTTAIETINSHAQKYGTDSVPLFLYLAYNSPHSPIEVDQEYYDLYPNIDYPLQRTYYGMISEVDRSIGDVVRALKSTGLWENTILVFGGDNGGTASPTPGVGWASHSVCGSNYPRRGSKGSNWEGGVRPPAVVAGGILPSSQRGKTLTGPIHIADWYSTFITLAGLDPTDLNPLSPSPVDGINQWPWISGQVQQSLRNVVVLDHNLYKASPSGQAFGAIIVGNFKLLIGPQTWSSWYWGPQNNYFSPNQSVPYPTNVPGCSFAAPCLFDISQDPNEYIDLAAQPISPAAAAIVTDILTNHWNPLYQQYHPPLTVPQDLNKYCKMLDDNQGFIAPYTQVNGPVQTYFAPTTAPTRPTAGPTARPTAAPSSPPSAGSTVAPTVVPSSPPTALPSASPSAQPSATPTTASPSITSTPTTVSPSVQTKICQWSGYCRSAADCIAGNKCTTSNLPYYSQCVPDTTTYATTPGSIANYANKCSSTSECADPGAYCDLGESFPQCHQPTEGSGLCVSPNTFIKAQSAGESVSVTTTATLPGPGSSREGLSVLQIAAIVLAALAAACLLVAVVRFLKSKKQKLRKFDLKNYDVDTNNGVDIIY